MTNTNLRDHLGLVHSRIDEIYAIKSYTTRCEVSSRGFIDNPRYAHHQLTPVAGVVTCFDCLGAPPLSVRSNA